MSSLLLLVPVSLLLLGVAVWAFVWAADHAQFEDLDDAGERILFEDDAAGPSDAEPEQHT